jgi:hypothetical protein
MIDQIILQQSPNFLSLVAGPFIGVTGAFILAKITDSSKRQNEKIVNANLALLTLKNQIHEFLIFRRSFIEDVTRNCHTGNEPLWALIRPAFIVFGNYQFDFKSIGYLLEKPGNGKIFDAVEHVQISHRDLMGINTLRMENSRLVQVKIVEYQRKNTEINWNDITNYVGGDLTALLEMVAIGMGLRADRNEKLYTTAFNQLRESLSKELDSYYAYKLKKFFSFKKNWPPYQLISIETYDPAFNKDSLPRMPKVLLDAIEKIPYKT